MIERLAGWLADWAGIPAGLKKSDAVPIPVVLDHVIRVLDASGVPLPQLRKLKQVKFIEPLLPDQEATVTAEIDNTSLSFSVTRGGRTIAKGSIEVSHEFAR